MLVPPGAFIAAALGAHLAVAPSAPALSQTPSHQTSSIAASQAPTSVENWSFQTGGEVDILFAAPGPEEGPTSPYGDLSVTARAETIRSDGTRFGLALGARLQRDSGRRGLSRRLGDCPPDLDECASFEGLGVAGLYTGLHGVDAAGRAGPRGGVETAYGYAMTGWGEARIGLGEGAARLEAEPLPGAFRLARADAGLIDPSGLAFASTANTLSGHAAQIAVRSRRLAGFRGSVSYTPDANACGVEACRIKPVEGALAAGEARHVIEAGLSFNHRFRASGQRWIASVTGVRGEASGPFAAAFEDPWAVSARAMWERGALSLGAGALTSNDGVADGRYTALSASGSYEAGDWLFAVETARAQSDLLNASGDIIQIGASRLLDNGALIGAGVQRAQGRFPVVSGTSIDRQAFEGTRLFVEAGLRF